ncbi:MAG: glycosyltransferase [Dehalococcoidia bacterium]
MQQERTRHIAIISEHASPLAILGGVDSGGQNVYVAQIARRLAAAGHAVDVFTRRDRAELPAVVEHEGYRVVHVDAGPAHFVRKEDLLPHMPAFAEQVVRFAADQQRPYDLAHANFWMSGLVAEELKRRLGVPFVITFHALGKVRRQHQGAHDEFPPEREHIETRLVGSADHIIAECPQDEFDLLSLYGAEPARISTIPCGYDPEECRPVGMHEARAHLGLPSEGRVLLHLGRLVPRKGVDNVVRAFARVRRAHPDAVLLIAGGESERPDPTLTPEIARLSEIAVEEGVSDAIHFLGQRPREEIAYWYAAADLFITTPWYEPFGITPVEAMACGTPVVGARVGGIQYTVVDGVTGLLVPPRDTDALAAAVCRLLRDEPLRRRFAAAGLARAAELFTWDAVTAQVGALCESVIAARERGAVDTADHGAVVARGFDELIETLEQGRAHLVADVLVVARILNRCFEGGGKVLVCGNGGSAADAQHFAGELVARYRSEHRRALPVVPLTTDTVTLTAWSNDVGFESVFARQVEALGAPDDVLLAFSTSGASPNVLCALEAAQRRGMRTVALLGGDGGAARALTSAAVVVPSRDTQRVQEVHGLLVHLLCDLVEQAQETGATQLEVSL